MAAAENHGRELAASQAAFDTERAALAQRLAVAQEQAMAAVEEGEAQRLRAVALEAACESDRRTIADLEAEVRMNE